MSTSMVLGLFDWIGDFFKSLFDLIPKIMYLLYASMACVLDVLQLFFRKLAGLDVYYVDGKAIHGDIVTNFITGILGMNNKDNISYSALSTVFWSMIVFGIIVCFACTIFAVIKSHYNYDEKAAKGPMQYVYTAGKAILNMVVVPIMVVLGLYVSEALLTALDAITSTNSSSIDALYGESVTNELLVKVDSSTGKRTSIYYDIFGFHSGIVYGAGGGDTGDPSKNQDRYGLIASVSQPFSGSLFKVAAYNGNRARLGQITIDSKFTGGKNASGFKLFQNAKDSDNLADMIDTAFACNLHAKNWFSLEYDFGSIVSFRYFTNYLTIGTNSFSKFNVGLVWYYYDLWQFNFIVGFAGIIVCLSIFINVILGLITRLFMCIVLFLVAPPLFGLAPLDGGKAGKGWRENFMKQALMAYGAVVGMNLVLMILPYMNEIDFFNIPIADYFAQTLVIIVGLITIKAVIATLSGLIGAADANETGGKIKDEVADVAGKATKMTVGAAKIGGKIGGKVGMAIGGDMLKAGSLLGKGLNKVAGGAMGLVGGGIAAAHAKRTGGDAGAAFKGTLGKAWASGGAGILKAGAVATGKGVGFVGGLVGEKLKNGTSKLAEAYGSKTISYKGMSMTRAERKEAKAQEKGYNKWLKDHQSVTYNGQTMTRAERSALRKEKRDAFISSGVGAIKNTVKDSAIGGMIGGAGSAIKGKALDIFKGKAGEDGKRSGGTLKIASAVFENVKADGLAGSLGKALGNASARMKLGKDGDKPGVLGGSMSLAHDTFFKSDSGLGKFLDSSEIKKKPDRDKETAENTGALLKNSQEQKAEMAEMTKAIKELASELRNKKS